MLYFKWEISNLKKVYTGQSSLTCIFHRDNDASLLATGVISCYFLKIVKRYYCNYNSYIKLKNNYSIKNEIHSISILF